MTFLELVVRDGIEAAERDYVERPDKRKGAVDGFRACLGKSPAELAEILSAARNATQEAFTHKAENYWEIRCFELEVEWTCNVVSSALHNQGQPIIIKPTARGYMKAAQILGVSGPLQGEVVR